MDDSSTGGPVNAEIRVTPLSIAFNMAAGVATGIFVFPLILGLIGAVATWDFYLTPAAIPEATDFYAFAGFLVVFYPIAWAIQGRFSPTEVWGTEDGDLVAKAPGSWQWVFAGDRRRLEVRSAEPAASGIVIRGGFGEWWDLTRYELDVDEDGAEALRPMLADL
ncbi:hypothetical protein [Salinibacter ruber]|uniref:hypothetical protein n=2 Tax=cellular organisms TaxID=131567 RepID=UPI002167FE19|nr:hypothetical protein [Salinibacter ruber]MCS3697180.1 hypothetical protein [Salinibacter ruber]